MRLHNNLIFSTILLGASLATSFSVAQAKAKHPFTVQVIQASKSEGKTSPKLKNLAKELTALKFKSFVLKNEIPFELAEGASGKIELPGGEWLQVKILSHGKKNTLRIEVAVAKLEFRAVAIVASKARVVVRGPPAGKDTLVLVITRRG